MFAIIDGTSSSVPFGLEVVLVLAALTFVALAACVVPIAFEMRRQILRSAILAEEMKRRIDLLCEECGQAARNVSDLAARTTTMTTSPSGVGTFFKALLHPILWNRSRKEAQNV